MSPAVRAALDAYRRALALAFGPRLRGVVLFGSHARGEARGDSDVDVLVLVEGATWRDGHLAADLTVGVMLDTEAVINPLVMSPEDLEALRRGERLLARDIDEQGVAL